ncbi:MAG: DNA primase, partial [Candidatus Portnoybacteria bacterium CG10_big_fil_rev_8_21_14_0_10_44_7]
AQRAGVVLKQQDKKTVSQKTELLAICELAAKFFTRQLEASQAGQKARAYLEKRGLSVKTVKDWRLGWAPDGWDGLNQFLQSKGYAAAKIVAAGLAIKSEKKPGIYDRFRSRIMFPLFDLHGQVIGFAGRIFNKEDDRQGKYINTPQTEIYDKSRVLYGIHNAKNSLRQQDRGVLVEGNLDVILSQQAGVLETVAASGTALGQQQLKIIKRYTTNLILAFDDDAAGLAATKKAAALALGMDCAVKIVNLPSGQDPADLIAKDKEKWVKKIALATDFVEFLIKKTKAAFDPQTTEGKRKIAAEILPLIKKISNPIERASWLSRLAAVLSTNERYLHEALQKVVYGSRGATAKKQAQDDKKNGPPSTREEKIHNLIMAYLLKNKTDKKLLWQAEKFLPPNLRQILRTQQQTGPDGKKLIASLPDQKLQKDCQRLLFWGEENQITENDLKTCFVELEKINLKKKIQALGEQITKQEKKKQAGPLKKNLLLLQKFLEELNNLENNGQTS